MFFADYKKINSLFCLLIFFTFFLGFIFQENAAGGGVIDFEHIYHNFLLFKNYNFFEIPWQFYRSSTLPLYYLIANLLVPENPFFLKFFSFIISIFCIFILLKNLKLKYNISKDYARILLLICCLPLLSPYFRTSAFYGLEENFAYLLLLLSTYFFYSYKKPIYFRYLAIFFSSLAFYARLNYAFLSIIIYFSFFNKKNYFDKKNVIYTFLFLILILPSLYFFFKFNTFSSDVLNKIAFNERIIFKFINIPIIFSILFFYFVPFFFCNLKFFIEPLKKKNFIFYILSFIIFYLFFINFFEVNTYKNVGGGLIYKLLFNLNIFNDYLNIKIFLFLFISFIGLYFSICILKRNINFLFYFFVNVIIFVNVDIVFQEYFDPLFFFIILLYTDLIPKNNLQRFAFIYFVYSVILLASSLIHKYYIVII